MTSCEHHPMRGHFYALFYIQKGVSYEQNIKLYKE